MADPQTIPSHTSRRWKLTLAYDGTDFFGWQIQPGLPTIQSTLADAIERVTGQKTLPQGSGRTDAGVHALGQVASLSLEAAIPPENLQRALNRALPPAIRVLSATIAAPQFHARHDAIRKTYEYCIFRGEVCPPSLARFVAPILWPLDIAAMQHASRAILGEHDFTSFTAADPDRTQRACPSPDPHNCVRTVFESAWTQQAEQDSLLIYRVTGSGFLHHMVRNLVGTFFDIGRGHLHPEVIPEILAARHRAAAGPTARASGLSLVSVEYPPPEGRLP